MRLVPRASIRPMRCAVLPHIGANHPAGFIDTGSELIGGMDNHVYVSRVAVQEMARMIGWVPVRDVKAAQAERDEALAQVAELEQQLAETQRNLDAVDQLVSAGFASRRKPGRPKQQREEVEA
jgi:hypothetical protein